MAPRSGRKRAAPADEDDDIPAPTQAYRNRAHEESPADVDASAMDVEDDDGEYGNNGSRGSGSVQQHAKSLVRYALACEFARKPIKRQDVNEKILGSHAVRSFKQVFEQANAELMDVFGMQMVELPNREKVTMRQKRAAAASESQNKTSNMWVLQNILPEQYRLPEIIGPSRALSDEQSDKESAYVGLYSIVIALIMLSGGSIPEAKLDRYLKRMNADQTTPVDSKDKLLNTMIKDGYIVRVKDSSSGEETVDYIVGPRGKREIGQDGVANLVRTIYGDAVDDLEQRLTRSLGIVESGDVRNGGAGEASVIASQAAPRRSGRVNDDGYE